MPNDRGPKGQQYRIGNVVVDCENFAVELDGQVRHLSPRAFDVLLYLVEHRNHVVGKEELFESVWKETFVTDAALTRAVKEIRHAIGDDAHTPRYIETLHKRGYRFIAPVDMAGGPVGAVREPPLRKWRVVMAAGSAIIVFVVILLALNVVGLRDRILGTPPTPKIQSIAVLPLKNLSGDPEQEYVADGMTDALITELGKISALRVISAQSMLQYTATDKPVPQIARELNVDALIEGSVLRSGARVRVNVQLVQAKPEKHLSSQSYERDLRDVLALQRDLTRAIAREIRVAVTPEEQTRLASVHAVNPTAHEAYVAGRRHWYKFSEEGFRRAMEYFHKALDADPR